MDGSFVDVKVYFKIMELTFSSELDWGPYIVSIAKSTSKKTVSLID